MTLQLLGMNKSDLIYLSGKSHYELGLDHGRKLKKEINSLINEFISFIRSSFPLFKYLPLSILIWKIAFIFRFKYPKKYIEEMRGIADGSGVPLYKILFINSFLDIGNILTSLGSVDVDWGCSGFLTKDKEGNFIIAKTYDLSPAKLLIKYGTYFCYDCKWLKHKFCFFGFPGVIAGDYFINNQGLTAFFFYGGLVNSLKDFLGGQPTAVFLRELFEKSDNFDNIMRELKYNSSPLTPYRSLISDGGRNSILVDIYGKYKNFAKYSGKALISTNHFINERMRKQYVRNYGKRSYYINSVVRYENLVKLTSQPLGLEDAKRILAYQGKPSGHGSIANNLTMFAAIKTFKDGKVYVTSDEKIPVTVSKRYQELQIRWR